MRERCFSSLLGSWAGKLAVSLVLAAPSIIPTASAFTFKQVPSPDLDIKNLGRVAFAGDFDSISLYQFEGQNEQSSSSSSPGSLLSRYPNGVFATLSETDADIRSMCAFTRNGTYQGVVFGGNFTSVGDQHTPGGIALLNTNDGTVTPLEGLNGSVNAVYCDSDNSGRVYIGGSFTGGGASNAIVWVDNWTNMPFSGFNGPVQSIVKGPNGNIIFGGQFNGLGGNATSSPKENDTQILPIAAASISAQSSSGRQGFSDPKAIVCKSDYSADGSGNTWLLADQSPGFWRADFGFGFEPTKLRLYNTDFEGRGAKTWRFTALPINGIMNFSYVDSSGSQAFCDARCPLPEGNTTGQDFTFVNTVGMNAFKIDISDWYGQGGGLDGIELYQTDVFTYAIDSFNANTGNCSSTTERLASTSTTGAWVTTPSHDSNSEYLSATLQGNPTIDTQSTTVKFEPDIKQSGNYTVLIYTPGCLGDGTCSTRGRVNITGTMTKTSSDKPVQTEIFQTNNYDKYDEIYVGYIDATDGFKPSITLQPSSGQTGTMTFVAQRIRFNLRNATSGGLNGLFEYNPSQQNVDTNFAKSVIDAAGASLSPQQQASITSLATGGDNLYVGGNFSGNGLNNIFSVGKSATQPTLLSKDGLNSQVMTLYQLDNTLYVGGNFTNTSNGTTAGLNGVAGYTDNNWQSLGAGVNGVVMYIVPFSLNITVGTPETVLAISGFFNQVNAFGSNPAASVDNFAIWVPSKSNWLNNLHVDTVSIQGSMMAHTDVPNADPIFAGHISSQSNGASGAITLQSGDPLSLLSFPATISAQQQQQSSSRKRAITEGQNLTTTGISVATFYKENNMNKTILAGHFAATGTDGQNITNLLIIDGNDKDRITGLGEEIDSNSTFAALGVSNNVLFAGGVVTGTVNNNKVAGVIAYDLSSNKLDGTQPPSLQGTNVTVNAIAPRPKTQDIYVGGNFASAGALSCASLCIWNTQRNQWTSPGGDFSGDVTSLTWISDTKILIAGNLTSGSNQTKIMSYDASNNQFEEFTGSRDLPGPVTALCPANSDVSQIWASGSASDGSAYLQRFDGNKWVAINDMFQPGTNIRGLQVLSLSQDHAKSNVIDNGQDLMILGSVNATGFGTASAVLFNGTSLTPFLLSTTSQGASGSLSQVFVENPGSFFNNNKGHLALGFIVLIALAIALALTFLLVVAGILLEWYRKKAKGYSPAPTAYPSSNVDTGRIPPSQLFGTLQGNRAPAI
ncbi:hypothetical protein K491DRAFT_12527 [Lophiostoma macrostomum CBS 122681]|uniref:Cellular morphogenesis protein n=1 Tax=Lophiostoma macrostomum CBS 122681 TaxID=1314788 RepID=A0A6A6TSG4_9PLEO|nr:hypothetical protein K491DRAFT_12527 [Lophiostoma macrostomum CBS 122681]